MIGERVSLVRLQFALSVVRNSLKDYSQIMISMNGLIPSYNPASRSMYLLMMSFMCVTIKSNVLIAVELDSLQAKYAGDVTGSELLRSEDCEMQPY